MLIINKIQKLIRSSTTLALFDQGIVSVGNLLTALILVRGMGLVGFGHYALVFLFFTYALAIQSGSLVAPMQSIGKKLLASNNHYYGAAALQQLITAVVLAVIFGLGFHYVSPHLNSWEFSGHALALSLALFVYLLQGYYRRYAFICNEPKMAYMSDLLVYTLRLAWIFILYKKHALNLASVLTGYVPIYLVSTLPFALHIRQFRFHFKDTIMVFKEHIVFGRWLVCSNLFRSFTSSYINFLAAFVLGAYAVGMLRTISNVMGVIRFFLRGIDNVLPIHASNKYDEEGLLVAESYLIKSGAVLFIGYVLLMLPLWIMPHTVVNSLYGAHNTSTLFIEVFRVYSMSYLFVIGNRMMRYCLRTISSTKPIFTSYISAFAVALLFSLPIVSQYL